MRRETTTCFPDLRWLSSEPQHRAIRNHDWSSLLLHEMFPDREQAIRLSSPQDSAAADPGWPVPPPHPVSEDDLAYPDDTKAIAHLFARLREYLDLRPASGDVE